LPRSGDNPSWSRTALLNLVDDLRSGVSRCEFIVDAGAVPRSFGYPRGAKLALEPEQFGLGARRPGAPVAAGAIAVAVMVVVMATAAERVKKARREC
jgi:hypothetical protein